MTEDAHELVCSGCGGPRDRGPDQRYCKACHAAANRAFRAREKKIRQQIEADALAAAYGKNVPRETITLLEKRCKGLP